MRRRSIATVGMVLGILLGMVTVPAAAFAQAWLGVVVVDDVGLSSRDVEDFTTSLEDLVREHGEFELVSTRTWQSDLSSRDLEAVIDCRHDAGCLARYLRPNDLDTALVAQILPEDGGYWVELSAVNLQDEIVEGIGAGGLDEPDAGFLLIPAYDALGALADRNLRHSSVGGDRSDRNDRSDRGNTGGSSTTTTLATPSGESNTVALALILGGSVLTTTGILFWIMADDTQEEIQGSPHDRAELTDLQDSGSGQQTIGNILAIGGFLVLTTGIIFELMDIGVSSGNDDLDEGLVQFDVSPFGDTPYVGIHFDF